MGVLVGAGARLEANEIRRAQNAIGADRSKNDGANREADHRLVPCRRPGKLDIAIVLDGSSGGFPLPATRNE
jgi:hypothetical protein